MFDLKVIHSVLDQLEQERGIPKEKIKEAIEAALATAYKKEYGEKSQIVKAEFDLETGGVEFFQVKIAVNKEDVLSPEEAEAERERRATLAPEEAQKEREKEEEEGTKKEVFNPEHHILIEDARKIKKDVEPGEEMVFPLEMKDDYGRIASQTAKQVIIQKIREAEKVSVLKEYGEKEGEIISGTVQRIERGSIFVDVGKAVGIISYEDQIPGERYNQGDRVRAYLYEVSETPKGVFLKLSRSHPEFLKKLFEVETPEIASGTVEVKAVAREAGSRTKIAVFSNDEHIDPVGSMVGQRGVRVSTVMSELGGERIDIIEWSESPKRFIEDAISPAKVLNVEINEEEKTAEVEVSEDQQSLAIGKGGQNVRLAAKLTGWRIDIKSTQGEEIAQAEATGETEIKEETSETGPDSSEESKETEEKTEDEAQKEEEKQDGEKGDEDKS